MQLISIKNKPRALSFFTELSRQLNLRPGTEITLEVVKVILTSWRDSLSFDDAIQVQTCLPVYLKPLFADGWKPVARANMKAQYMTLLMQSIAVSNNLKLVDEPRLVEISDIVLDAVLKQIDSGFEFKIRQHLPEIKTIESFLLKQG
jgi:uncharacterized protein (DUF2267 family)